MEKRKVVIVGAGVIGCCSAYFLSAGEEELEIIVLERNVVAGCASGKAGGFLALDWCSHNSALDELTRASYRLHRELAETLDGSSKYEYRALETYALSMDLSDLSKTSTMSESVPHEFPISKEDCRWINGPAIDFTDPNQFERIGDQSNTSQVHPELFSKTLLEKALETGKVSLKEGVIVEDLIFSESGKVNGVKLSDGECITQVDDVILCIGPWSSLISAWIQKYDPTIAEGLRKFIISEKYYSVVIEPKLEEDRKKISGAALFLKNNSPVTKLSEPEVYPRPSGKVYVCGCEEVLELPDDPACVLPTIEEHCERLSRIAANVSNLLRVEEYYPESSSAKLHRKQACYLPISRVGIPLIGPINSIPGLWIATGHGCWGILNAPATGKLIAEYILQGKPSLINATPFTPNSLFPSP